MSQVRLQNTEGLEEMIKHTGGGQPEDSRHASRALETGGLLKSGVTLMSVT